METVETYIQVKLHPTKEQEVVLKKSCEIYVKCLNEASKYYFEHDCNLTENQLKKSIGKSLRDEFGLSPLVASAIKEVLLYYKEEEKRLKKEFYIYPNEKGEQKQPKDLSWLKKPIVFKEEHVRYEPMYWKIKYGGVKIALCCFDETVLCEITHKKGVNLTNDSRKPAKLVYQGRGCFYFFIQTKMKVKPEIPFEKTSATTVVGIDIGERFIITAYDGEKTIFVSGKEIVEKAKKYQQQKAELTEKNSQHAREKLKAVTQKERNWLCNVNHKIAKDLVERYGKQTVFVFEDLPHAMFQSKSRLWFLERLEEYFRQKIALRGAHMLKVSAQYTSQRCPYCGKISKKQRNHNKHEYRCSCGFRTNDDRVSAINLHELGQRWLEGEQNPRIVL